MSSCQLLSALSIISLTRLIVHQAARVQHSGHSDLVSVTRDASIEHAHNISSLIEETEIPDGLLGSLTTTNQLSFALDAKVHGAQNGVVQSSSPSQPSTITNESANLSDFEAATVQKHLARDAKVQHALEKENFEGIVKSSNLSQPRTIMKESGNLSHLEAATVQEHPAYIIEGSSDAVVQKSIAVMIDNCFFVFALALIVSMMCFRMAWEVHEEEIDSDSENAGGVFAIVVHIAKKALCCYHRNRSFSRSCADACFAVYKSKAKSSGSFETDTDPSSSLQWHVDLPRS